LFYSQPGAGGLRAAADRRQPPRDDDAPQELLYSDAGAAHASARHGRSTASHHVIFHVQTAAEPRRQGNAASRSVFHSNRHAVPFRLEQMLTFVAPVIVCLRSQTAAAVSGYQLTATIYMAE